MQRINFWLPAVFLALLINGAALSQESEPEEEFGWKEEIIGNLSLTQASFDNWTSGGESAFAWQSSLGMNAIFSSPKYEWKSTGYFSIGYTKIEGESWRKSSDEIKIESVLYRKLKKYLNPFFGVTAKSQFAAGFEFDDDGAKTKISQFLDPGYFTQTAGVGIKPYTWLESRLGGTLKQTVTRDFNRFSDDPETADIEKIRFEPGISWITNVKKEVHENILLTSRLDIFSDLEAAQRIDVLWENVVNMKVTSLINVKLEFDLLYDRDVSTRRQIRQALAVGISYSLL